MRSLCAHIRVVGIMRPTPQIKKLIFEGDAQLTAALQKAPTDGGLAVQTFVLKRFPDLPPAPVRLATPRLTRSASSLAPAFAQLTVQTAAPPPLQTSAAPAPESARPTVQTGAAPVPANAAGVGTVQPPPATAAAAGEAADNGADGGVPGEWAATKSKRTRTPSFRQYSNSPSHVRSRIGPSPKSQAQLAKAGVQTRRVGPGRQKNGAGDAAGSAAGGGQGVRAAPAGGRRPVRARLTARTMAPNASASANATSRPAQAAVSAAAGPPRVPTPTQAAARRAAASRAKKAAGNAASKANDEPAKATTKGRKGKGKAKPKRTEPRRWSGEEDAALRKAVSRHGEKNWKAIAESVPGRNHVQCLQRWKKVLRPGLVKGHWTGDEDRLLRALVAPGPRNWGEVSGRIPGRTAKQCRERWCNHLDPRIKKGNWTPLEDEALVEAQAYLGKKWAQISKYLPGRTENAVKIRWKSLTRRASGRVANDAATVRQLLQDTQASVAKHLEALRNGTAPGPEAAAAAIADVDGGLDVDGTGYVLLEGALGGRAVPAAPATSSDRFSPFDPRTQKDSDAASADGSSMGRSALSATTALPQALHLIDARRALPPQSAIVRLAAQAFATGSALTRVGLGGIPRGAWRGGAAAQDAAALDLEPFDISGLGRMGMGVMPSPGVSVGLGAPMSTGMSGVPLGAMAGLHRGAAFGDGLSAGLPGGLGANLAGLDFGLLGMGLPTPRTMAAAADAFQLTPRGVPMPPAKQPGGAGVRPPAVPAASRGQGPGTVDTSSHGRAKHVGLGGFAVDSIDTSTPRQGNNARQAPGMALPSPFNLSQQLAQLTTPSGASGAGASNGGVGGDAGMGPHAWAWLENAVKSPSAKDKNSLQRAAAAQAVTSAAAAQATAAGSSLGAMRCVAVAACVCVCVCVCGCSCACPGTLMPC